MFGQSVGGLQAAVAEDLKKLWPFEFLRQFPGFSALVGDEPYLNACSGETVRPCPRLPQPGHA